MATRSTIAVIHEDGTVSQIYCHYDGYVSFNGKLLVTNYNNLLAAEFLVSKGDLSTLGERVTSQGAQGEHSFSNPEDGVCVYYGRDRGETGGETRVFPSVHDYRLYAKRQEVNYLFIDGEWLYQYEVNDPIMKSVVEELKFCTPIED
jgi:hypothetical protein